MSQGWRAPVLVGALLLAAGCSDDPPQQSAPNPFGDSPPPVSDVKVDTPKLRELKAKAGMPDCPESTAGAAAVGGGLPDITLPCLGGGRDVTLSGLTGRPTVVNLWASWCDPCREELPLLQEFATSAEGTVDVVGVDFTDTRPEAALELARRAGVTYPSMADVDGELKRPLRVRGLPWTVLVDADGRIVHTLSGQIHSIEELDQAVEEHLGVRVDG